MSDEKDKPYVDRTKVALTDGSPVSAGYDKIDPKTGLQSDYLVLAEEERLKGFVRQYREKYVHVGLGGTEAKPVGSGCGVLTTMHPSIAETYARDPKFYGSTYCVGCMTHFPVEEFMWADTHVRVGE